MNDEIMVTITCAVYNHEKYLRKALDGFVMQKTNFKYEVLVHDDASTDGSADIIREYQEKYPDIIRSIIQTENQYSQGISIGHTFLYPNARGKYFAPCEGDDYWISEHKLQKLVDFLESHPDYTMCCHNSYREYVDRNEMVIENPVDEEGDVSAREMILEPNKTWIATSSLVYRREMAFNRPEFFRIAPVGDVQLRFYCFWNGKVYYFKEPMSVYRRNVSNAWSTRLRGNYEMRVDFNYRFWKFLVAYDEYTERAYHKYVRKRYLKHKKRFMKFMEDYPKAKNNKYFKQMPLKFRLAKRTKYYHPTLFKVAHKLKGKH